MSYSSASSLESLASFISSDSDSEFGASSPRDAAFAKVVIRELVRCRLAFWYPNIPMHRQPLKHILDEFIDYYKYCFREAEPALIPGLITQIQEAIGMETQNENCPGLTDEQKGCIFNLMNQIRRRYNVGPPLNSIDEISFENFLETFNTLWYKLEDE